MRRGFTSPAISRGPAEVAQGMKFYTRLHTDPWPSLSEAGSSRSRRPWNRRFKKGASILDPTKRLFQISNATYMKQKGRSYLQFSTRIGVQPSKSSEMSLAGRASLIQRTPTYLPSSLKHRRKKIR